MVSGVASWNRGRDVVLGHVQSGALQQLHGEQANGDALVDQARHTLESAVAVQNSDPRTAVVLAYDAARAAAEGLLAQQGLRAKGIGGGADGHHVVVAEVVRAQFGPGFNSIDGWRRRRNDLSYPSARNVVDADEAADAIADAADIVEAAEQLIVSGSLGFWR
jgi:hypothetical protein